MAALRTPRPLIKLSNQVRKSSLQCWLPPCWTGAQQLPLKRLFSSSQTSEPSGMVVKAEGSTLPSEVENILANMPSIGHKAIYDMMKMAVNLKHLKPALPTQSVSLAPYVNDSETLQQLVKLGIDLSRLEKEPNVATHLALADFETDCKPYILFYHSLGVKPGGIGEIISRYPKVFFEPIKNLEVRVNYFISKKFSLADVANIVARKPTVMAMTTKEIDSQLGYLQKLYKLNGNDLRSLVIKCPTLIAWKNRHILSLNYQLSKDLLEFNHSQRKEMLLEVPEIAFRDPDIVQEKFDYLTTELGLPVKTIVEYPLSLSLNHQLLKMRHRFLAHLGRTQYDPELPNFIPLSILMGGSDQEFCEKYVKVSNKVYKTFLKTL